MRIHLGRRERRARPPPKYCSPRSSYTRIRPAETGMYAQPPRIHDAAAAE
jgi:hypothetical protein